MDIKKIIILICILVPTFAWASYNFNLINQVTGIYDGAGLGVHFQVIDPAVTTDLQEVFKFYSASTSLNFEAGGYASASQYFNIPTQIEYIFNVQNIPTARTGAASSSTGFEYMFIVPTAANTFPVATSSANMAVTMSSAGRVRGCSVTYGTLSTTGGVSIMITKNGVLLTPGNSAGKYCKVANFAVNGNVQNSATQNIPWSDIPFVAGDRFLMVASSNNLSAATMDGVANIVFELKN